ncbi:hypothetical protein BSKO_00389 [Bryopsis sp. KO-2023]|nr:hypothetical protein BSKO_00389 [Bryopsis sp. KO-2023]
MADGIDRVDRRTAESFFFKTVGSVQVCSNFKSTAVNRLLVVAGDSGLIFWADGPEVKWSRTHDLVERAREEKKESSQEDSEECWATFNSSASSLVTVLSLSLDEGCLGVCREDGTLEFYSVHDIASEGNRGKECIPQFSTALQGAPTSLSWQGEKFVCLLEGGDVRRGTVGALEDEPVCVNSIAFGACSTEELWANATESSPKTVCIHKGEQSTEVSIPTDGVDQEDMVVNTIYWINAQTILIGCALPSSTDTGLLHLVTLEEGDWGPNSAKVAYVDLLTIEMEEFGKEMGPHLHTCAIHEWGITFVAHGKANDMHFRTLGAADASLFFLLDGADDPDGEITVPPADNYDDNYLVGVGMDFTSEEVPVQRKVGDLMKDIGSSPLMVLATTDGYIRFITCGWDDAPYSLVHKPNVSEEETPQKTVEEEVEDDDDTLPDAPFVSTSQQGSLGDGTPATSEKDCHIPLGNDQEGEEAVDGTPSPATSLSLKQSGDEKEGKSEGSGTVGAFDTPSSSSFSLQPSSTPQTAQQPPVGFGTFNESTIGSSPTFTLWGAAPEILTKLGTSSASKQGAFASPPSPGFLSTPVREASLWESTSHNSGGIRPKSPEQPGSAMSGYGDIWHPTPLLEGDQGKSTFGQMSGDGLFGSQKEGTTRSGISDSLRKSLEAGVDSPTAEPGFGEGPSQNDNSSDNSGNGSESEEEEEEEEEEESEEGGSPSFGDADNELHDADSPTITNGTPRIPDSGQFRREKVSSEEESSPGGAGQSSPPSNFNDQSDDRFPPGLSPAARDDTPIPPRGRFGRPAAEEDPSTPPRGRNLGLADLDNDRDRDEEDATINGEQRSFKNPYFDSSSVPSSPGGLVGRRQFALSSTPGIPEDAEPKQASYRVAQSPASDIHYQNELAYPPGLGFSQAPPSSSRDAGADVDRKWREPDSSDRGLENNRTQKPILGSEERKEEDDDKSLSSDLSEKSPISALGRVVDSVTRPDGEDQERAVEKEEEGVPKSEQAPDRNKMVEIRRALEESRMKLAEHDEDWKRLKALAEILKNTKKRGAIMKERCQELEHRLSSKHADEEIKSRVERVKETYRRVNSAVGTLGILQSFFKGNRSCNHTYATRQGQSAYYAVTEVIQEINAAGNSLHVRVEKLRAQAQKHRQIVQQGVPQESNPMKLRTPWASMSPADRKQLVEGLKKREPTISYAPGVAPRRRAQPDTDVSWISSFSSETPKAPPPPLPPKRLIVPGLTVPKRGPSEQKSATRGPGPSTSREQGSKRPPPGDEGSTQDSSSGGPPGILSGIGKPTSQPFKVASQGGGGLPPSSNQDSATSTAPAAVPSGVGFSVPSAKASPVSASRTSTKRPAMSSSSDGFSAPSVQQNATPQASLFGSLSQLSMSDPSTVPTSKPPVPGSTPPSTGSVFGAGSSSPSPATPNSAPAIVPKPGPTTAFGVPPQTSTSPVPFGSSASLSPNSGAGDPSPAAQSPPPGQGGLFSGFSNQASANTGGNVFAKSLQVAGSGGGVQPSSPGPFAQSPTASNPTGLGFGVPAAPQPPNLGVSFGNSAVLGVGGVASQLGSLQSTGSQPQQVNSGGGGGGFAAHASVGGGFEKYVSGGGGASGFGNLTSSGGGASGFGNLTSGGGGASGFGNLTSGAGSGFGTSASGGGGGGFGGGNAGGFSGFPSSGSAFGAVGAAGGTGFGGLGGSSGFGGAGNSGFGQPGLGSAGDNKQQNQGAMWQPRR